MGWSGLWSPGFNPQQTLKGPCGYVHRLSLKRENNQKMSNVKSIDDVIINVARIIIDELMIEDVTPQTFDPEMDLVDEVGIDSMDLATVALVIQDEYGIRIDEDDYPKLTNVRLIAEYINNKL